MKRNNNDDDDDDDDDDDNNNNNNTAMGSFHARGDTFLTFGLKALTETNTSRLATATSLFIYFVLKNLKNVVLISPTALCTSVTHAIDLNTLPNK
jgi:hypothetical protein